MSSILPILRDTHKLEIATIGTLDELQGCATNMESITFHILKTKLKLQQWKNNSLPPLQKNDHNEKFSLLTTLWGLFIHEIHGGMDRTEFPQLRFWLKPSMQILKWNLKNLGFYAEITNAGQRPFNISLYFANF